LDTILGVFQSSSSTRAHRTPDQGEMLLRKTAWAVFDDKCTCEYGYSDTWQPLITDPKMKQVLREITHAVVQVCGGVVGGLLEDDDSRYTFDDDLVNSVNLNFYPRGGGVGFHAGASLYLSGVLHCMCFGMSIHLHSSACLGCRL